MTDSRRGSALLIVLGMLSFMVVSAVGFSVYMRQGRLPSSYLRRNVASRYLVKAALANAIEDLDGGFMSRYDIGEDKNDDPDYGRFFGIYDNPYPGVGQGVASRNSIQTGKRNFRGFNNNTFQVPYCENGDLWFRRVFCPFGLLPYPESDQDARQRPPLTVPTLTLEALAYLPPAIADDVRRVSRMTRTAQWHQLPYEAGRYAYTVVNVSDLFDINRLRGDVARDSGANRITLTALGGDSPVSPSDYNTDDLADIQVKAKDLKVNGQVTPFISLADFNLVTAEAGKLSQDSTYAPFMNFIGQTSTPMLDDNNAKAANGLFITDTWFPPTNNTHSVSGFQPFKNYTADSAMGVFLNSANNASTDSGTVRDYYEKYLGIGLISLYDYLDGDSIPISLAFPTTEAVPMVVGVGAPIGLKPDISNDKTVSDPVEMTSGNYAYNVTRTLERYKVTGFSSTPVFVNVAVMYPFKRMVKSQRTAQFKVRGLLRIFLVPSANALELKCRDVGIGIPEEKEFRQGYNNYENGIATFASDPVPVTFSSDNLTQADTSGWIKDVRLQFDTDISIPILQNVSEKWEAKTNDPDDPTPVVTKDPVVTLDGLLCKENAVWRPRGDNADNSLNTWTANFDLEDDISNPRTRAIEALPKFSNNTQFRLVASVSVQVLDSSDHVVDMVPASADDDEIWCKPNGGSYGDNMILVDNVISSGNTILPFITDYSDIEFNTAMSAKFAADAQFTQWNGLYAVDPRFNHAPENWFAKTDGNTDLSTKWCTALGASGSSSTVFGQNGRDRDVFMFVSDQEYLQSIGELQFLPFLESLNPTKSAAKFRRPYYNPDNAACKGTSFSTRLASGGTLTIDALQFMDKEYFWRTYSAYEHGQSGTTLDGDDRSVYGNPYSLNISSEASGFKLNPYSEDVRVVKAAILGTPYDYYVASTNANQIQALARKNQVRQNDLTSDEMLENYSFSDKCNAAKMTTEEQNNLAGEITDAFADYASEGKTDYIAAWDDLEWQDDAQTSSFIGDNNKSFLNATLSTALHGVDRKYLYSFWRECFDNRQQLFLIFVRAEPTSIGGGASGAITSAQLGGRAVALVWRDPAAPTYGTRKTRLYSCDREQFREFKKDVAPHRSRILFFHQFD